MSPAVSPIAVIYFGPNHFGPNKSQSNLQAFSIAGLLPLPLFSLLLSSLFLSSLLCVPCEADEIVLRNQRTLSNVTVSTLDEDGITLGDGTQFGWDSILSANVAEQEKFDRLHKEIGLDLFRLRVRLQRHDVENFQPHLDKLYPIFAQRQSSSALVVHIARVLAAVEAGSWELAIESHFRIFSLLQSETADTKSQFQRILAATRYPLDSLTGLSPLICPFGFDREKAVANWESILAAYQALPASHPTGLDFYFFLVAEATESHVDAKESTNRIKLSLIEKILLQTLLTATHSESNLNEIEGARVKFYDHKFSEKDSAVHRALYHFVSGLLEIRSEQGNQNEGLLNLLRIHAEHGRETQAISAAALFEVYKALKEEEPKKDAKSVADELLSRYPSSIFAKQLRMKETE